VPKQFKESGMESFPALHKPLVISELSRQERLLLGYAGAMGMREFAWSRFHPSAIIGKLPDSDVYYRLTLVIEGKIEKNPDAELVAMIYLASIGEQL
jgi:hypothetical protein